MVSDTHVRQLRQILLWPLQLAPIRAGSQIQQHWQALEATGADNPWREVIDEFAVDASAFKEQHYNEFVTFLPYVQRFLYGEGRARRDAASTAGPGASPMRVFRRDDVAAVRVVSSADAAPIVMSVASIELYFFYDIDIVLLKLEAACADLTLAQAQDTLYRFGRAYPAGWDDTGRGLHCMHQVEWLDAQGQTLAISDVAQRDRFLSFVSHHRAPRISAHWEWLLRPLALDNTEPDRAIHYRLLEYYRMPVMAYLAMDDPRALSRDNFLRLGLVAGSGDPAPAEPPDFETRVCYDRFWREGGLAPNTRYMCNGHALVVVGEAKSSFFTGAETGVLAQFRHQHFLLFLIAHFQKAALLMFSDRLVDALNRLDISEPATIKTFKRSIRQIFEIFLRFTHRYWFHEISEQAHTKALFALCAAHLHLDSLYCEVRERIHDMSHYLDADSLRRQANTVVRLTVVTAFGLIGTVATGFLGMNLIDETASPLWLRVLLFAIVLTATIGLTFYTISKSKRLSDFLDALSDEHLPARFKAGAFLAVWRSPRD
ncbi:MAG: hypothetical protein ACT4OF_09235 [Caulobacteraceae bacterium]